MLRFLLIIFISQLLNASEAWKFESIYDGDSVSLHQTSQTMLYRSSDSTLHIFYGGDHLYHLIQYDDGSTVQETVDNSENVGSFISSDLAPNGSLHVSYIDTRNNLLKYAVKAYGGDWSITSTNLSASTSTSICVDENNLAHILYETENDMFFIYSDNLAQPSNGAAFISNASKGSIACDNGKFHIAYASTQEDNEGLYYLSSNIDGTDASSVQILGTLEPIQATSIDANNASNKAAIGLYYNNTFKIFEHPLDNQWLWSEIGSYPAESYQGNPSVKVKDGNVYASFYKASSKSSVLELFTKINDIVDITAVLPSSAEVFHSSLAFIDDNLFIQYTQVDKQKIGLIHSNAGEWIDETVHGVGALKDEYNLDILSAPNGIRLTFETPNNTIAYLTQNINGSWNSNPIPASGIASPSITYVDDLFLSTWIQYYDAQSGSLERRKYSFGYPQWRWHDTEAKNIIDDANVKDAKNTHDSVVSAHTTHSCFIDANADLFYVSNDNTNAWSEKIELYPNDMEKLECAIDIDTKGYVHIVFSQRVFDDGTIHAVDEHLYHISNEAGDWNIPNNLQRLVENPLGSKRNLHISSHNDTSIHIGYSDASTVKYLKSPAITDTRIWPNEDIVVPLTANTDVMLGSRTVFDMGVDSHNKAHFVRAMGMDLYHSVQTQNGFKTEATHLDFDIKGIKITTSKNRLHVIMEAKEIGDIMYAELPLNTVSASVIMYLLN